MVSMQLLDANVLLYAARRDTEQYASHHQWLEELIDSNEAFGVSDITWCGVIRIATNPKAYEFPSTLEEILEFANYVRSQANYVTVAPGPQHWAIFANLCSQSPARGNLVTDAYLAALAIEHDCELISNDRDFAKFPGLRWRHPLDA
jgi:uncharacterized protein